jgi:hypothetical protein
MGVPAPTRLVVPTRTEIHTGRPVTSATLGTFAGALNYLAYTRGRHWTPSISYSPAWDPGDGHDSGFRHNTDGHNQTHRIIVPTSLLARHLALVVLACARSQGGSTAPTVTAALQTASGGVVDPGVIWRRDDGTFPAESFRYDNAGTTRWRCPAAVLHTGAVAQDSLIAGGIPTQPRLLSVEDKAGDVLMLVVTTASAAVLSVTAWEWPETEIPT